MAITIASIDTNFNTYIGDSSTDRISAAERLQYETEAVVWLQEELGNDYQNATYELDYFDTVHEYKITTAVADLLTGADLRREFPYHTVEFARKSPNEIAVEISNDDSEPSWAIERKDKDSYLIVNFSPKHSAKRISSLESTSADGGTWEIDSTNSDATNLTVDSVEFKEGNGCLNFDITVAQSGNNKAVIKNESITSLDLSDYEDLASWLLRVYLPTVTYFSSVTLRWGSDTSNYWTVTSTTDITGSAAIAGWNRFKFDWASATPTGTPDETAVDYISIEINYTASQADDTDYRIDDLMLVIPEPITFHYVTFYVGTNSSGTELTAFTATTDIPFFSGQYDNYKYAVAHKAASLAFYNLRLRDDAKSEEKEAYIALERYKKITPSQKRPEVKSFKVRGVSFGRRSR